MKNILFFGDSICQNYSGYVSEQMKDAANVYVVRDNCRFTTFALRYLHEWFNAIGVRNGISFDVIHFNCGLWDVLRLSNEDGTFTSDDDYKNGLIRIINRIRWYYPDAKLVFALSTKVVEPGFEPGVSAGQRLNADIERFNSIAMGVCKDLDVDIDNLWSVSCGIPQEGRSDVVHFETEIGAKILGEAVVKCLKNYI